MAKRKVHRGRGEGTIRLRADGRWEARVSLGVDPSGRTIRRSVFAKTKTEVVVKAAALRVAPVSSSTVAEPLRLSELKAGWVAWLRTEPTKGRAPRRETTIAWLEAHYLKHVEPELGGMTTSKIRAHHVEALLAQRKGSTATAVWDALRSISKYALKRGAAVADFMAGVSKPAREKSARVKTWTSDEARRVLEAAKATPYFAAYALAIGAGLRRGEIFGLTWRHLDLKRGVVSVEQALSEVAGKMSLGPPKTRSSMRSVELPAFVVAALETLPKGGLDELVFADSAGGPVRRSNFDRRVHKAIIEAAGVRALGLHGARHTSASLLLAQGESILSVAGRLGHADPALTLRVYAHLLPGGDSKAASALDRALADDEG